MTKEQCIKKIEKMIPDVIDFIAKEANRLLNSGAVDTDSYEDNFALPKIILIIALRNAAEQYMPLDGKDFKDGKRFRKERKEIKNLSHI